uniref:Uncharacterized protein n=1 Tax=Micrurus lemniscatus lemniscatus TaxID=129467 RepID=A0A2D4J8L0_MICLE
MKLKSKMWRRRTGRRIGEKGILLLQLVKICVVQRKLDNDYLIFSLKLKTGFEIGKSCLYECRDAYDDGFTPSQARWVEVVLHSLPSSAGERCTSQLRKTRMTDGE